jgi:hypothetical protein
MQNDMKPSACIDEEVSTLLRDLPDDFPHKGLVVFLDTYLGTRIARNALEMLCKCPTCGKYPDMRIVTHNFYNDAEVVMACCCRGGASRTQKSKDGLSVFSTLEAIEYWWVACGNEPRSVTTTPTSAPCQTP